MKIYVKEIGDEIVTRDDADVSIISICPVGSTLGILGLGSDGNVYRWFGEGACWALEDSHIN